MYNREIRVKEFMTKKNFDIEEQINSFVESSGDTIRIVDIKYVSFLDTIHDSIISRALLVYEKKINI